ncbi:MAG: OmpA family protein [Elusimicrobiota bacterium]|jgi:outer membrane protein OmpA-like peptidoglycan-associated protein|nr:OmpA family protein [Elusimicrobiota bacterium]
MKKNIIYSLFFILILFSGCSNKQNFIYIDLYNLRKEPNFFYTYNFSSKNIQELKKIVNLLQTDPLYSVLIKDYILDISVRDSLAIAQYRADKIISYLQSYSVDTKRVDIEIYGKKNNVFIFRWGNSGALKEKLKVELSQEEPQVELSQEEPKIELSQEEPKVELSQEEPKVELSQEEPQVELSQEYIEMKEANEELEKQGITLIQINENDINNKEYLNKDDEHVSNFEFKNIYFGYNKSKITKKDKEYLEKIVEWLNKNPDYKVLVEGYTDSRGSVKYNLNLGGKRVNEVAEHLETRGINSDIIKKIIYTSKKKKKETEAEHAKNRRVEISFIKNINETMQNV